MSEKPILFSAPMVRAILDGAKTQTRRVINLNRLKVIPRRKITGDLWSTIKVAGGRSTPAQMNAQGAVCGEATNGEWLGLKPGEFDFVCPYCNGETVLVHGEGWRIIPKEVNRLWVRETFNADWCDHTIYRADGGSAKEVGYASEPKWKPSIYMPRKLSRILLRVTDIRVERIQNMPFHDIRAEGVSCPTHDFESGFCTSPCADLAKTWIDLWDSINAKRGFNWKSNPWVWVVEFERIK